MHYTEIHLQLSKPLIIFFKLLHIFFGYDFGFFKYKSNKIKYFVNIFGVFQSISICLILISSMRKMVLVDYFWYGIYLIQYVLNVIVLASLSPGKSLCSFRREMRRLDHMIKCEDAHRHLGKIELLVTVCFIVYRMAIYFYFYLTGGILLKFVWANAIYLFVILCLEYISIYSVFIFLSIYYRLKVLVSLIKSTNINSLVIFYSIYKSIADTTENFKKAYDPMVSEKYFILDTRPSIIELL